MIVAELNKSGDSSQYNSPTYSHHSSEKGSPFHSPKTAGASGARYFIMKCGSQRNIDISVSKGAWATSKAIEQKLNKAFQVGYMRYNFHCKWEAFGEIVFHMIHITVV